MSPRLLIPHVIRQHEDANRRYERAGAANGRVKDTSTAGLTGRGDGHFTRSREIAPLLEADFLTLKLEVRCVSSAQRDVDTQGQVDLRVVGSTVEGHRPGLQAAYGDLAPLGDVEGAREGRRVADVHADVVGQLEEDEEKVG